MNSKNAALNDNGEGGPPWSDDYEAWYPNEGGPGPGQNFTRNQQYRNAYPNYEGGYGGSGRKDLAPQNIFTRRGFVPQGSPYMRREGLHNNARQFLIRCGITKNVVKNLPTSLLVKFEPDYCRLCAMSFDNFDIAALHYTSKNHSKKQQKWLREFNNSEKCINISQAPMKARELYCELCDVPLTSKSHADSHYSGKTHRAIVDGRKAPKNPFLNQAGMEKRLQQLIKREKRKMNEGPVENNPVVAAKKLNKFVSSELYCGICKISVTCLEQMTNHMNGKKHLSKEKQYILNSMQIKGDETQQSANEEREEKNSEDEEPVMNVDEENNSSYQETADQYEDNGENRDERKKDHSNVDNAEIAVEEWKDIW